MAEGVKLSAQRRSKPGTAEARRLRRDGRVPGVVYGHGEESVSFSTEVDGLRAAIFGGARIVDIDIDGNTETTLLKDVQWDTFGEHLMHVDLQRVSQEERVEVDIVIELHGIAPGVAAGGVLDHQLHALPVECPALQIPDKIEVNVNHLELHGAIHVSDLDLPDVVTVLVPPETLVVQVREAVELPEEEQPDIGPVEPELVGRERGEAEGEG